MENTKTQKLKVATDLVTNLAFLRQHGFFYPVFLKVKLIEIWLEKTVKPLSILSITSAFVTWGLVLLYKFDYVKDVKTTCIVLTLLAVIYPFVFLLRIVFVTWSYNLEKKVMRHFHALVMFQLKKYLEAIDACAEHEEKLEEKGSEIMDKLMADFQKKLDRLTED